EVRAARGMTRAALAEASNVSLRFLAQIETAHGNPSLLVMRKLASALGVSVESLVADTVPAGIDRLLLDRALNHLTPEQLRIVRSLVADRFSAEQTSARQAISLIGLRGAGKTTHGRGVARRLVRSLSEPRRG